MVVFNKKKCKHLFALEISGGEACLHPQFMEICKLCHEILPNVILTTTTNGTLLKKSDEDLKILQDIYNIQIRVSLYPNLLQTVLNRVENKKIIDKLQFVSRPVFHKISFLEKKESIITECACIKNNIYFLYQGNFYPCNASMIIHKINYNFIKNKSINLKSMKIEDELFLLKENYNLCNYCNMTNFNAGFECFYHTLSNSTPNNYFESIEDIFNKNYQQYEKILTPTPSLIEAMNNVFFLLKLDKEPQDKKLIQRFYGDKDYIILINETSDIKKLQQNLFTHNNNLYFILINTNNNFNLEFYKFAKTNFELSSYVYKKESKLQALEFIPYISFCEKKEIIDLTM